MKRRRRIFWQIYPAFVIVTAGILLIVAWYTSTAVRKFHYAQTQRELLSAARLFAGHLQEAGGASLDSSVVDPLCEKAGQQAGYRLTVILLDGKVAGDSEKDAETMENHRDRPEFREALLSGTGSSVRHSPTMDLHMMYVAVPLEIKGRAGAVVRASLSVSAIDESIDALRRRIVGAGVLGAVLAALFCMVVSRGIAKPLEQLRVGAQAFARGRLEGRLSSSSVLEIDALSRALNDMAGQLAERIDLLTRQRDQQNALLACMVEGVIAVDEEKRIIRVNRSAGELFGVEVSAAVGKEVVEVIRNADLQSLLDDALESRDTVEGLVFLPSGERYLQVHGAPLKIEGKQGMGALVVLNDVTDLRRLETMRREFVANVSHELKTPVTSIRGFAETLMEGAVEDHEDRTRFLQIIHRQAVRLQSIINDLLILSTVDHGTEEDTIELQVGRVNHVLDSAVQACAGAAAEKNIEIGTECGENLYTRLSVQFLEQAVMNLVDNAVKYSEDGTRVDVTAQLVGKEVAICVKDNGSGIAHKHLARIFERFYRVDHSRSRKLGGTGLGLAIVKRVAMAHHGRVTVESEVDKGSRFCIYLPACDPPVNET